MKMNKITRKNPSFVMKMAYAEKQAKTKGAA